MSTYSEAKIRNEKIKLYIGFYGSELIIGNVKYGQNSGVREDDKRLAIIKKLKSFTKNELVDMIIQLIDNSEE